MYPFPFQILLNQNLKRPSPITLRKCFLFNTSASLTNTWRQTYHFYFAFNKDFINICKYLDSDTFLIALTRNYSKFKKTNKKTNILCWRSHQINSGGSLVFKHSTLMDCYSLCVFWRKHMITWPCVMWLTAKKQMFGLKIKSRKPRQTVAFII